jgi:hypothetical protein
MPKRKKVLLIILEVIALAVLTIASYLGSMWWLLGIIGYIFSSDFPPVIYLVTILIFDVLWLATIKFWPLKNIHIKIILTLLVIAFSAAFITSYTTAYMLRDFPW